MKSVALHSKLTKVLLKSFTIILFFAFSLSSYSQDIDEARQKEGRKIFKSLCASCHKLDKKLIGPALAGVEDRRENDWLKSWIKDNAALRASGDRDAIEVFEEYKGSSMTAFPQLSDQQVDNILYYTTVGEIKKATEVVVGGQVLEKGGAPGWLIYFLAAAIIVAFLMIASLLKQVSELKGNQNIESNSNLRRDLEELWIGLKKNTFLKVLSTIFLLLTGAYIVFGMLFTVGVDQGYQPIQPIEFSHKIHAGDNKIDCQYCHSAAKHSKTSGIPSANVCMNCHMNISEVTADTKIGAHGKDILDKEIQKLYDAVGWDAAKLKYTGETKPIEWVRIHNLPDFAYFNHSQHVTVGQLECQECHGAIEEMDVVKQSSELTMGWCIECHRETEVKMEGNDYYTRMHEKMKEKYAGEKITVEKIGGLECGKCHY